MKTRVVYIAGQSYSGSTFFCALLGIHPQMEPVSELSMWTKRGLEPGRLCACGSLSKDCKFWSDVRGHWLDGSDHTTLDKYTAMQDKIETISYAWPQMLKARPSASVEFEEYARLTTSLYRSIAVISGRPAVVDSSKKPARAIAVSNMDGLEVAIIHLVRNGLSYVNSNIRRMKLSPAQPGYLYNVFRLGLRWSVANYAAERAMLVNTSGGIRVRYEDLLSNPVGALESVGEMLKIDMQCVQDHVVSGRPVSYRHMESGSRHRRFGPATLRIDHGSPPNLDRRIRFAFYLGAGMLSRRYGYL